MKYLREHRVLGVNEGAVVKSNSIELITTVEVPMATINSLIKSAKDNHNLDIINTYGKQVLAEKILKYILDKYMNPDQLNVSEVLGLGGAQAPQAPQAQGQDTTQTPQAQPLTPPQAQAPQAQAPAQPVSAQGAQAQVAPPAPEDGNKTEGEEEEEENSFEEL